MASGVDGGVKNKPEREMGVVLPLVSGAGVSAVEREKALYCGAACVYGWYCTGAGLSAEYRDLVYAGTVCAMLGPAPARKVEFKFCRVFVNLTPYSNLGW